MIRLRHTCVLMVSLTLLGLAGCASSQLATEVAALRAENEQLREQVQRETGKQMRDIVAAAITNYLDEHGRLPARHSDLRAVLGQHGWTIFIAPYDRTADLIRTVSKMEDPWAWIDEHGSYEWLDGEAFNSFSPVLVERSGTLGQTRWVVFGDCHGEQLAYGGAAWRKLGLP